MVDRRPTKAERREMARKNKIEEQRRRARRRRRQRLMSLLTAVVAIVAVIGAIQLAGKSKRDKEKKLVATAVAAGCTAPTTETDELAAGVQHLSPPATGTYKTNPPNSGTHFGANPVTGVFEEPRQSELWLHNLEHGHVGILYKDTLAPAVKAEVAKFGGERNTLAFVQPKPDLPEELVFVAWTKLMRCAKPTDATKVAAAAKAFFDVNVGHGPEGKIPAQPIPAGAPGGAPPGGAPPAGQPPAGQPPAGVPAGSSS